MQFQNLRIYYYDSQKQKGSNASMKFYGDSYGAHMVLTEFLQTNPQELLMGIGMIASLQALLPAQKMEKHLTFI